MKPTEEQKLEAKLMRRYRKALKEFELIEDGDRMLIGLSGGKDSLFLVEMLGRQQAINRPKIEVHAIHIRMQNIRYESDTRYLEDFCQRFGVNFVELPTNTANGSIMTDRNYISGIRKRTRTKRLLTMLSWKM